MKVVESGYKMDLHIHSVFSRGKDHSKVAFNTLENVGVLANKLNENGVQICAITDHDAFSYDMYKSLKGYELKSDCSIIKVFPGVEFSVEFEGDCGLQVLHVIAVFNDENDEAVKLIESILVNDKGVSKYDRHEAFSEERFLAILRQINLDTILIVHQKNSLASSKPKKNDANSLGEAKFKEIVYTDYFEAYEFKNRKNEVFNKYYLVKEELVDDIRFITGSDCHDWRVYPREDENEKENTDFVYTYVKCIPSFRGLVMAMTDHRRIKRVNSFFNSAETYIPKLELSVNGEKHIIPLSRGINVIIGDNSIGKSLLLHRITDYRKTQGKLLNNQVVKGYKQYLKSNNIEIETVIPESDVFEFDMQGEIRTKFEQNSLKPDDFLKPYYPAAIVADPYKEKINRKLELVFDYLEKKFDIAQKEAQLGKFELLKEPIEQSESISFVGNISRDKGRVEGYSKVESDINTIIQQFETLNSNKYLEKTDKEKLSEISEQLLEIAKLYERKRLLVESENKKKALVQSAIAKFKEEYQSSVSDMQKLISNYNENVNSAADSIAEILYLKRRNNIPDVSMVKEYIPIATERVYNYEFNSRLGITEIDEKYITNLLKSVINKNAKTEIWSMSQDELCDNLPYFRGTPSDALEELKNRVYTQVHEDLSSKFTITQAGKDRTQELSAGLDSQIYFDMLSYETKHSGVYIIDQPEDNISQKAIRDYLLDRFKVMGEHRQVLMVTHRPQFIVNLDVDNVIFIGKDEEELVIRSGALEYQDEDYCILDIIAENIEGGLETLRRRWKRYEKNPAF